MNNIYTVDISLFLQLSYKLLEEITRKGEEYRAVLCPLRGGFHFSDFMSRHLNVPMAYLEISSYKGKERRNLNIGMKPDLDHDRFLLCDDIYDSGNTVETIHSMYPHVHFDTYCLISKVEEAPVSYGMHIDKETWVNFFWEIW